MEHPIEGLMKTAMESLRRMIDVNTIIGDPIQTPDGSVVIPVSKVGFGFAAGGSEFTGNIDTENIESFKKDDCEIKAEKKEHPFGGGSGGGVSVSPIGFIVVDKTGVRFLPVGCNSQVYDRLFELIPKYFDKWTRKKRLDPDRKGDWD